MTGPVTNQRGEAAASVDPMVGRLISDRFRILDLIARGGMGKVYRAEQVPLGRLCAIKVLHPRFDDIDDPEFQKRFFLEAATAANLSHPNTVTVFDYGRDGDIYYIAMEYIHGRTLFRALRDDGPFAESRVIRIMKQVCRSLREAHQLGVIHRDMKPGNVVLVDTADEADTVKVLDFGLVKQVDETKEDLTQEGMFMGSPKYMAPEQILGNPVSRSTDVYALGIVAYELLCGKPPFDEGTSVKTMMAHLHKPLPGLRARMANDPLSVELETILNRCLAKDPSERFDSMEALLIALQRQSGDTANDSLVEPRVIPTDRHASRTPGAQPSGSGAVVLVIETNSHDTGDTLVTGPPSHLGLPPTVGPLEVAPILDTPAFLDTATEPLTGAGLGWTKRALFAVASASLIALVSLTLHRQDSSTNSAAPNQSGLTDSPPRDAAASAPPRVAASLRVPPWPPSSAGGGDHAAAPVPSASAPHEVGGGTVVEATRPHQKTLPRGHAPGYKGSPY